MAISARKVKDYDLYSGHAWYVPGVKGMFGFIGWFLLSFLTLGIGLLWLIPYVETAQAAFYEDVKADYAQNGGLI